MATAGERAMAKARLGRGLTLPDGGGRGAAAAMAPDGADFEEGPRLLPVGAVLTSGTGAQALRRGRYDAASLEELAASIREAGVLQPILVRPLERPAAGFRWQVVAGERRLEASRMAGLGAVPAVVRRLDDAQALEAQLVENLQREGLHELAEAEGFGELVKEHGLSADDVAAKVGRSRSHVYGRLKLLALCEEAREAFAGGQVPASVALALARVPGAKLQREALEAVRFAQNVRHALDVIQGRFTRRLAGAPFDPEAKWQEAGPCSACAHNTSVSAELFADAPPNHCANPPCWDAKAKAHVRRKAAQAEARGEEVLRDGVADRHGALKDGWIEAGGGNWRWREVEDKLGDAAPKPKLALLERPAFGPPRLAKVVSQADADAALKAAGKRPLRSAAPAGGDRRAERARSEKLEAALGRARERMADGVVAPHAEGLGLLVDALWRESHSATRKRAAQPFPRLAAALAKDAWAVDMPSLVLLPDEWWRLGFELAWAATLSTSHLSGFTPWQKRLLADGADAAAGREWRAAAPAGGKGDA